MATSEQPRIFNLSGKSPESSAPRSSCQHSPAILAKAMRTLTERYHLPDVTTKRGLKESFQHMDEIISALIRSVDALNPPRDSDVHITAAAYIYMSMVAADPLLCNEIDMYPQLYRSIPAALNTPCDLLNMAALMFLLKFLTTADSGCLDDISVHVIPLVQRLIVTANVEDLVLELCLDVCTEWALFLHAHEKRRLLIKFMTRLAAACGQTSRRQIASHILHRLQHVTGATGILGHEEPSASLVRNFFMAALRYDSAGDRLTALRALFQSFRRELDGGCAADHGVYPIAHMSAADYTLETGETQFHGLDTTRSDAKHLLDLRAEFANCMRAFCSSRDAHELAKSLHDLLLRDPRAVDFSPKSVEQFAGGNAPAHYQLRLFGWSDTLRHCAETLRACTLTSCGDHAAAAHVLELQNYILCRKLSLAAEIAYDLDEEDEVHWLWCLYAVSHDASKRTIYHVVRAAKDWITSASPITKTPLYECLLASTALSTLSYVLSGSLEARMQDDWDTLTSRAKLAIWASSEYLRSAPFDGQYVAAMNEVYLLGNILRSPPTSSTSPIPSIGFPFEARWRAAAKVHSRIWDRPTVPRLHTMVASLYANHKEAVAIYSTVLNRHLFTTPPAGRSDPPDALDRGDLYVGERDFSPAQIAAWRELISGAGAAGRRARMVCWRDAPSLLFPDIMQVGYEHRMSACGNCGIRSVVLRRCGACKAVRYCARDCQAEDWKNGHRYSCPRTCV